MNDAVAIVLAAGKGTRMKSNLPKVLHEVCGRSMVEHVFDAVRGAGVTRIICVIGHEADLMRERLGGHTDVEFALQVEQNGTGHAVQMTTHILRDYQGPVLILAGDTPLLRAESLKGLLDELTENSAVSVVGSAVTENNVGLGRIVRDASGEFTHIVEEKDADDEQRQIKEINTGCYAFDAQSLFEALSEVKPLNTQGEYYLTDCPAILRKQGKKVLAAAKLDIDEAMGVNTKDQLAAVAEVITRRAATSSDKPT
ncbi:MAG: NTP transferase domain-containing protein [Planctomycetota bacterium]|nr:NTP transferase domain-containing protein [Planctomycetota bacterium]MDA1163958.1 NTP transferase domain-containing protein [Planctomycetota bacterium]